LFAFVFLCSTSFKEKTMTIAIAQTVANPAAPTAAQIQRLVALGINTVPATRSEASQAISAAIAQRDMQPATLAQIGRAAALGGRDLPGAGVREKSTQIYLLEALVAFDNAASQEDTNAAAEMLIARVRERLVKPLRVTVTAPKAEDAPL
jgi:hypothetical protein